MSNPTIKFTDLSIATSLNPIDVVPLVQYDATHSVYVNKITSLDDIANFVISDTIPSQSLFANSASYADSSNSASYANSGPFASPSDILAISASTATVDTIQNVSLNNLTQATSSYVTISETSSLSVASASVAQTSLTSVTASYAANVIPQNNAFTSSYLTTQSYQVDSASIVSQISSLSIATSSYVQNSQTSSFASGSDVIKLFASSASSAVIDTVQTSQISSLSIATSSYVQNSQTSSFASGSDVIKLFASSASSAVIDTVQTSQISSLSIATSSYVQNSQTSSMTVATSSLSTSSSYAGGVLLNNIINLASGNVAPLQHAPDTSTGLVTQTGGDARYIPQGGTLTSALALGGHALEVAMAGDVIANFRGANSIIGIDYNYNPYLETSQGFQLGFDSVGNVSFAGFSLYNRYGDFLYATGKIFADSSGSIYYATGSKFADSSGSIYYATGNKFADFRGNIYYATGNTFADFHGNIYYATGNTFADYYGSIYYNTGNVFVDYSSNIYYATGNTFADFHGNIYYNTGNKLADSSGNLFLRGGLYDSFNSSGSAGNFLSNNGSGKAVWGPVTVALAGITDMSFTARTANTAAVNTSGGIVTMGTVTTLTPTGASPAITINLALGHTFIIATSGATGTPTILFSNIPPDAWCNIYVKQGTTALNATFPTNTVQAGGGGVTYTATGASTNDMIAVTFLDSTHPVIAVTRGYN
jgi:hypothetical protein